MDVQAAKALVEEDAFAPRGFQDDDAIIAEQRSLDLDDRKGKARASFDVEDHDDAGGQEDGRRLLGKSNGTAGGGGKKHVRLMEGGVVLAGGGADEDEDEVPRRSMNGARRLGRRRGPRLSKAARRREYWRDAMINVLFILSWYFFATLISLYNKWMFSPDLFAFEYPLFVTTFHMAVQFILAGSTLVIFAHLRPDTRPSKRDYLMKATPCGVATGADIGLSNNSLKLVTLSFYTMCKSSTLAFVLLFAFIFQLEKPTWRLCAIIALITAGVVLMVSTETQFNFVGMVEVLVASCMGGLRWSLTQLLLEKEKMGMANPIATIFWLAPIMGLTLALCSLVFEGWANVIGQEKFFGDVGASLRTMAFILFPGVLAFLMNVSEFALIKRTSVVTLSIAGIFKEVGTIFLSTVVFGDVMTPLNISGLIVTILGIALYNILKYNQSMSASPSSPLAPEADKSSGLDLPMTTRTSSHEADEETFFLADGTSYSHPREFADPEEDEDSVLDASLVVPSQPEPVNPSEVDHLRDRLDRDPDLLRLDVQEAKLEGLLEAGLHHDGKGRGQVEEGTHHVIGGEEDEDEDWGGAWEVEEETGNGLVVPPAGDDRSEAKKRS